MYVCIRTVKGRTFEIKRDSRQHFCHSIPSFVTKTPPGEFHRELWYSSECGVCVREPQKGNHPLPHYATLLLLVYV